MSSMCPRPLRACALTLALLGVVPVAGAQRHSPRAPRVVTPPPLQPTMYPAPYTGEGITQHAPPGWGMNRPEHQRPHEGRRQAVILVPVAGAVVLDAYGRPVEMGYGTAYPEQGPGPVTGSYPAAAYPGPVSYPPAAAFPAYTPDFSGTPYVVVDDGAMLVDLPTGERQRFPACAAQSASKDPTGRPRTVFYPQGIDGVILHEGSRGRVQGIEHAGATSCYTTDSFGRMALQG